MKNIPLKLYNKKHDSYCTWDGSMYINDGKVAAASFWSLEKAANNGFYPIENENRYRKQGTYLVLDEQGGLYRWQGDKTLFFAGSEEDALIGLEHTKATAIRVCDADEETQKEYEQLIDTLIENGTIEL